VINERCRLERIPSPIWKDQGEPWYLAINERFPYELLGDRGRVTKWIRPAVAYMQGGVLLSPAAVVAPPDNRVLGYFILLLESCLRRSEAGVLTPKWARDTFRHYMDRRPPGRYRFQVEKPVISNERGWPEWG